LIDCLIAQGYIYVPETKDEMIVSLVCNKFRARLSEELVVCLFFISEFVMHDDVIYCSPLYRKLSITWQLSMTMSE